MISAFKSQVPHSAVSLAETHVEDDTGRKESLPVMLYVSPDVTSRSPGSG